MKYDEFDDTNRNCQLSFQKMSENEEMMEEDQGEASGSESDSSSDETERSLNARLEAIEKTLAEFPFDYAAHVEKISILKDLCELERLRAARETFASKYPLTPDLWLAWIKDERGIASTPEEKEGVFQLFKRGVGDYASVPLYLEHCQFALGSVGTEEGNRRAREVFEEAITAVGLNVNGGGVIWDAYREFELALMQCSPGNQAQRDRVEKLFKRQLAVPLFDMEATLEEYLQFTGQGKPDKAVEASFKQAKQMLEERKKFEENILQSAEDAGKNREVYKEYVDFEIAAGQPTRITCLYERRATQHCLVPEVWLEYLKFLDTRLKIPAVSLPVHERAVRNCTWSGDLWSGYMRALEKYGEVGENRITLVFERALGAGLSTPPDYLKVWLGYIDFRRRATFPHEGDGDEKEDREARKVKEESLRTLFSRAVESLASVEGADPQCRVARFWASVEGDRFRAMDKARSIWADNVRQLLHFVFVLDFQFITRLPFQLAVIGGKARFCLEYVGLEKMFGDTKHLRKLFPRLLDKCQDMPELVGDAWLQFEREEGSLEQFEEAESKTAKRMARAYERRLKEESAEAEDKQQRVEKVEKKKEKDKEKRRDRRHQEAEEKRRKRKATDDGSEGQPPPKAAASETHQGFKVPSLPGVAPPPGYKAAKSDVAPPPGFKGSVAPAAGSRKPDSIAPPPGFPTKDDVSEPGTSSHGDNKKTVFLSNLGFDLTEEVIREAMERSGEVKELRLIKSAAGKSKGFAYVEFSTDDEAKSALQRDHEKLNGRPMYVSVCDSEKKGHQFQYGQGLEKNKLFVKGLPKSMKQRDVERVFAAHGTVKAVRLIEYRNGTSKGIAFVEFASDAEAARAIMATDGMELDGMAIEVAISNPPAKKGGKGNPPYPATADTEKALGGGRRGAEGAEGPRGRGRSQLAAFMPRVLMTKSKDGTGAGGAEKAKNGGAQKEEPKSNQEFRQMFLGGRTS